MLKFFSRQKHSPPVIQVKKDGATELAQLSKEEVEQIRALRSEILMTEEGEEYKIESLTEKYAAVFNREEAVKSTSQSKYGLCDDILSSFEPIAYVNSIDEALDFITKRIEDDERWVSFAIHLIPPYSPVIVAKVWSGNHFLFLRQYTLRK